MTPTYRISDIYGNKYEVDAPEDSKLSPWDQFELKKFLCSGANVVPNRSGHWEPWR